MSEVKISATKAEDIFKDEGVFEVIIECISEFVGDPEGAYVCSGENLYAIIDDSCEEGEVKYAKSVLTKYMDKLVVFNYDCVSE